MAIENGTDKGAPSANETESQTLTFPATDPIYRFIENADSDDIKQHLDMRLSQLEAMLSVLTDMPPFIRHSDVRMGDYFTACETLARECKDLSLALDHIPSGSGNAASPTPTTPQEQPTTSRDWHDDYQRAESALINIESLAIGALESINVSDRNDDYIGAGSHLVALIRMRAREGMGVIGDWTKEDAA